MGTITSKTTGGNSPKISGMHLQKWQDVPATITTTSGIKNNLIFFKKSTNWIIKRLLINLPNQSKSI